MPGETTPQPEIPGLARHRRRRARVRPRRARARYTGALAFEDPSGIRRVLFRDGDFVTAASGADGESPRRVPHPKAVIYPRKSRQKSAVNCRSLAGTPGAALIAQGHLRQDDLWPVLRAHAEWLVARIVLLTR